MKSNHTAYLYFGATVITIEYRDLCVRELRTAPEQLAPAKLVAYQKLSYRTKKNANTISISKHFQEFQVGHTFCYGWTLLTGKPFLLDHGSSPSTWIAQFRRSKH